MAPQVYAHFALRSSHALTARPPDIEIGQYMQDAFEKSQSPNDAAHAAFLEIDARIGSIISEPPVWLSGKSSIKDKDAVQVRLPFVVFYHA